MHPNVLCFITDQQRVDHLGCYGNNHVLTPNLDGLAKRGIVFDKSYVVNPVCMPNRASLFTGRYPGQHGVRENGIPLSPEIPSLPEILGRWGYETALFGKLHLSPYAVSSDEIPAFNRIAESTNTPSWELAESKPQWDRGHRLPEGYRGFHNTYFVGGHGDYVFGDYYDELVAQKDDLASALSQMSAIHVDKGVPESWISAIPEKHHYNTRIADETSRFLLNRSDEKPFFAWCSFPDPHHPYAPASPYAAMYDWQDIEFSPKRRPGELDDLPSYVKKAQKGLIRVSGTDKDVSDFDDMIYRKILARTYAMISHVDAMIGLVLKALKQSRAEENTIVIFLSDHGDLMGDHWLLNKGPFLFDGLVRTPMIWKVPEGHCGRSDAMISSIDLAPTILDLCDIPNSEFTRSESSADPQPEIPGRSFGDIIRGLCQSHRDAVFIEHDESYIGDRLRQIRTPRWSLTMHANESTGLLFDLDKDPGELHNLWHSEVHADIRNALRLDLLNQLLQNCPWTPLKRFHA